MSIYVRPVREQIEHDRVIRHLQSKLKRKFDVAMNVGPEQFSAAVRAGTQVLYPDLVLATGGKRLEAVIEVETGESVHHLEAMAQWAPFGRLKVPFHLYVPAASADMARRLAADLGAHITELWSYHAIGDQVRTTLVEKTTLPAGRGIRATIEPPRVVAKPVPPPPPPAPPVPAAPAKPVGAEKPADKTEAKPAPGA
ncbi:MAG: hypothetical protein M3R55_13610, partial [Acidobacteriota bacterium]|nr:hypothetical protein [Acidobacteriota bacterium]